MVRLHVTDREGESFTVEALAGISAMEAIRETGRSDIQALCGGTKACATCQVYVAEEWFGRLPAMDEDEDDLLDGSGERQPISRLSCQIRLGANLNGLALTIAPEF